MVSLSILYVHFRDRNVLLSLHQCFLHVIFLEFISQCVPVMMQILIVWTAVLYFCNVCKYFIGVPDNKALN